MNADVRQRASEAVARKVRAYEALGVRETAFLGYERIETDTVVAAILKDGEPVQRADAGARVEIVLRETPFYPEGGGQVGDTGLIAASGGSARVSDTQKPFGELIVHAAEIVEGAVAVGDAVHASVDEERRLDVARNHTATHLLHAALRDVLGSHVRQAGSLVAPDRLRFDFTHVSAVSRDELSDIERRINESVRGDLALVKGERSYREATADGALAFFGERYGERVRTVQIGEAQPVSFEVCGGTHLERTGQIGTFRVVGESSVGTGVRRIEAVTGRGGEEWVSQRLRQLDEATTLLRAQPAELPQRIEGLLAQSEEARRSLRAGQREASRQEADSLLDEARDVGGVQVLAVRSDAPDAEALRELGDRLRDKLGSGVVVLGSVSNGRPGLLAMVTPDLVERGVQRGGYRQRGGEGDGRRWRRSAEAGAGRRQGRLEAGRRACGGSGHRHAADGLMRALGLDVGERRIGVASGDTDAGVAVPVGVIENTPEATEDVAREARTRDAEVVVVGMPYSMSGRVGPQAQVVQEFAQRLEEAGLVVETVDERLSSMEAERALAGGRVRGRGRRKLEKGAVDTAAAVVILQAWLDGRRK